MAVFCVGDTKIDTATMTTEELIKYRNEYQRFVDNISHEIKCRIHVSTHHSSN